MNNEEFRKLVREQIKLIIKERAPVGHLKSGDNVVIVNTKYKNANAKFVDYNSVTVKVGEKKIVVPFSEIEAEVNREPVAEVKNKKNKDTKKSNFATTKDNYGKESNAN